MNALRPSSRQEAFTLIELLAVVALIALLAALLLSAVGSSLARAKEAQCGAQLKTLGQGVFLYAGDHGARLPRFEDGGQIWDTMILPYLSGNQAVFRCPEDPHIARDSSDTFPRTYAVNGGVKYLSGRLNPFGGFDGQKPLLVDQLRSRSGRCILIGERPGDRIANRGWIGKFPFCTLDQLPGDVHRRQEGGNYFFSDGSVKYLASADATLSASNDFWYVSSP